MLKYLLFLFSFSIVPVTPLTVWLTPHFLEYFPWMAKELLFFPIAMWSAMILSCIFFGTLVYYVNGVNKK